MLCIHDYSFTQDAGWRFDKDLSILSAPSVTPGEVVNLCTAAKCLNYMNKLSTIFKVLTMYFISIF